MFRAPNEVSVYSRRSFKTHLPRLDLELLQVCCMQLPLVALPTQALSLSLFGLGFFFFSSLSLIFLTACASGVLGGVPGILHVLGLLPKVVTLSGD